MEVVTSDEQVLRAIASCGAKGIRSQEFLADIARAFPDAATTEKPDTSSPAEIAEWLNLFRDEPP